MTPEDAEDWMRFMAESKDDALHPDLAPYLETGGTGVLARVLRHPLVYQVPYFHPGMANEAYRGKVEALATAEAVGDLHTYVFLHERPWRLHALLEVMDWDLAAHVGPPGDPTRARAGASARWENMEIAEAALAEIITSVWTDSENVWQNAEDWAMVLGAVAATESGRLAMDEDEAARLDGLPDVVTIWRGAQADLNEEGFSWSLNRETARWFATRLLGEGKPPVLVTGKVAKTDILGVLEGRSEDEVVALPEKVDVVSVEPVLGSPRHPGRDHDPAPGDGGDRDATDGDAEDL